MKKFLVNGLVVAGSIFLVALSGEMFLASMAPVNYRTPPSQVKRNPWITNIHRRSSVPGLAYELAPNRRAFTHGCKVVTNSYGMRDNEPLPPSKDLVRILAIGDSYTFGFGVAQNDVWPRVLENCLNASPAGMDRQFNVLNMGVGGYSSYDEALVLRYKGLQWNPELVIIGYVLNDPETEPWQSLHSYFHAPEWWQYSNLCRLVARGYKEFKVWRLGQGNYSRYLHVEDRAPWQTVLDAFHDIGQLARDHGFKVLVVIFPDPPLNCPPDHFLEKIYLQVAKAAAQNGLYAMKLSKTLKGRDYADLRITPLDDHPNALCHRLVGEAIAKLLLDSPEKFFPHWWRNPAQE